MMKRLFLALGMVAALGAPLAAQADKFPDGYAAARKEMNALGDKALAGDKAALKTLEAAADDCADTYKCPAYSEVTWRGAAAATNLGWLYWSKEAFGADQKRKGMAYFARAAQFGSPQGLYQVGDCMRDDCMPANVQALAFGGLFEAGSYKPFFGGRYERLKAVSALFGQAADRGLVAAAVEKTKVDNQLVGMTRNVLSDWDAGTVAIHSHLNGIIDASLAGLAAGPSADQRDLLDDALANARAQAGQFEAEAAAARARRQGGSAPAPTPAAPPKPGPPPKGENYAADRARALDCIEESETVRQWRRELDDWARDLRAWDDELDDERVNLSLAGGSTADYNAHNARIDAFNEEGREYDAEQRRYNAAADTYNGHCRGSFNGTAIDEVCTGDAKSSKFCRAFR